MKRKIHVPLLSAWDVSVFFLIVGILSGTLAALWLWRGPENVGSALEQILAGRMKPGDGKRESLFFQVWLQRAGMALVLWLAGMTPVAFPAAWGSCFLLGMETALLMAGFTGYGGIWGLPLFGATVFPQGLFYMPVFFMLLSWSFSRERRVRGAAFLILLIALGMGAAMEVWLNPALLSFLVSHRPF